MRAVAAVTLVVLCLSTAHAADPTGTLTLACDGTSTSPMLPDKRPEPVSMGIIINFTTRTVHGFGHEDDIMIKKMDDAHILFFGSFGPNGEVGWLVAGGINRVTGEALVLMKDMGDKTAKLALMCRVAQRMF
jgi:hypothetical protein